MQKHFKPLSHWVLASLLANGVLLAIVALVLRHPGLPVVISHPDLPAVISASPPEATTLTETPPKTEITPKLGPRHQLTYEQWVDLLAQEAKVAAEQRPQHLAILVGDSLSLWFPGNLLPPEQSWLNQGISGETSSGLLQRLSLFDGTQPDVIFVMIGINDLIRGISDDVLLDNQQQIMRYLRETHPNAEIVVQSILPHAGNRASWQGRDRLASLSNDRIRQLNQKLGAIAATEKVRFLDLHPLFTDTEGNLRSDFSTDGLHLSSQGYLVWRSALQLYHQLELQPLETKTPGS